MEQMIIEFFRIYGWKLTLIACSGICVLGILKKIHAFNKIKKEYRKYIYSALSSFISITAAGIYLAAIHGFNWAGFGLTAGAIFTLNQTIYAVYENTGLRDIWQRLGQTFKGLFLTMIENAVENAAERKAEKIDSEENKEETPKELE